MKGCDVIACGEVLVLEHVPNAGSLLKVLVRLTCLRVRNGDYCRGIAFSIRSILAVLAGTEIVHADHKYYFSWRTLKSLLETERLGNS
jgi:hypothetical protein